MLQSAESSNARVKLWFLCAAMHDPVTPVVAPPAVIGWKTKEREVESKIEKALNGDSLFPGNRSRGELE